MAYSLIHTKLEVMREAIMYCREGRVDIIHNYMVLRLNNLSLHLKMHFSVC